MGKALWKIGDLEFDSRVVMAPMAGITDVAFRQLSRGRGEAYAVTEMVSAKAFLYQNRNTEALLQRFPGEGPLGVQLFGSNPDDMALAGQKLADRFELIDVNMGCPVPKIVRNGEGSALMRKPDLAFSILKAMTTACPCPITVKFRKGFSASEINCVEFAVMAEEAGVSAITVHARTREEFYSGRADWEILRKVKYSVHIPVIGNGDVFTPLDAERMIGETGVDAVAIARGMKGNPSLLGRTVQYLSTGELIPEPDFKERLETIRRHTELMIYWKGKDIALREMRKHISWYTSGLPGSARIRDAVNHASSIDEMLSFVDSISI